MNTFRSLLPVVSILALNALPLIGQAPAPRSELMDDPADQARVNRARIRSTRPASAPAAVATLPTGWTIGPAGGQIPVGTLPFSSALFNGAVITVNGGDTGGAQSVSAVDPATGLTLQTISIQNVFPSVAAGIGPDFLVSGGYSNVVYRYDRNYNLVQTYPIPGYAGAVVQVDKSHFAVTYYSLTIEGGLLRPGHVILIDTDTGRTVADQSLGAFEANAITLASSKLYVTVPAMNTVEVFDSELNPVTNITVGEMPQNTCEDGETVYALNTNADTISVIDTQSDAVTATYPVNFRNTPFAAAPSSCSVDADTLYVTLTNVNAIALLNKKTGTFKGYIPTGWYPTSVIQNPAQDQLYYVSAKGIQPRRPNPGGEYVLSLLQGSVGVLDRPDILPNLAGWTRQVLASPPLLSPVSPPNPGIDHIFYIVKENRTYDQVLGDLPRGNNDPSLTQYGNAITPVQHYIAQEFTLLDNFFVDGEVSTLGHSYTSSAYASPYFNELTSLEYSGRLSGTSSTTPGAFSPIYIWDDLLNHKVNYHVFGEAVYFTSILEALSGYLGASDPVVAKARIHGLADLPGSRSWLNLGALLKQYSSQSGSLASIESLLKNPSFGQPFSLFFTGDNSLFDTMNGNDALSARVAELLLHYDFSYEVFNLNYSDLERISSWLPYFEQHVASGTVEPFEYLILPNDHTGSTGLTDDNDVAQNDAALDIFMRALSQSNIWRNSVVFVVEDDAQDGSDHVDANRTTAYIAGPRVRHGQTNSEQFDQDSMVRSISWLLGVPPLNMDDTLAIPMFSVFSPQGTTPVLDYDPPPVSTSLAPADLVLYQQLLTQLNSVATTK